MANTDINTPAGAGPRLASGATPTNGGIERRTVGGAALQTDRGTTSISDAVVAKIASLATQEIPGVQAMGKSMARTIGSLRAKIPGGSSNTSTQGVTVEVGERQAAIDIDIVAYYGQSILEVANAVRANVVDRIEGMTGLEVVEVNVSIDDLYIEGDGGNSSPPETRVA